MAILPRNIFILTGLMVIVVGSFMVLPEQNAYGLRKKMAFEDSTSYVRGQVVACLKSGESGWRGRCFRELGGMLSTQLELSESLSALADIDDEDGIKQQCHSLVHYLGQNEFKKTGSLPDTFRSCLSSPVACGEGCFHGAVEAYVSENGGTLEASKVSSVCNKSFTENQVTYDACVHGLGHAFMLEFEGDIKLSLDSCSALTSKSDREFCYAGVFMENVFSFWNPDHPSKFIRPEDPAYPCNTLDVEYQSSCYASQAAFVMNMSRSSEFISPYKNAAKFCATVPVHAQSECFGAIGSNAVVATDNPEDIVSACVLTPTGDSRTTCYKEALVFSAHGSGGAPEPLRALCDAIQEKGERVTCLSLTGAIIETWFPGKRAEVCARIAEPGTDDYDSCRVR